MPKKHKRLFSKKNIKKYKRHFKKKKKDVGARALINKIYTKWLLPRRLITTCESTIRGYYIVGAGGRAQIGYQMVVNANYPVSPFAHVITGQGDSDIFINISAGGETTANLTPTGFRTLVGANQYYNNYRVYAVKVTMNCLPQSNTDDSYMLMVPNGATAATAATAFYNNIEKASQGSQCSKVIPVSYYSTTQNNKISKTLSIADIVGVTRDVVRTSPNYIGSATVQPIALASVQCFMYTQDGTDYAANPTAEFTVKYYLELFNPNEYTVPDV